ncbi:PhoX family protein [Vibrio cholerae]
MWKRDEQESQFSEMIEAQLSRRHFLAGSAAVSAGAFLALNPVASAVAAPATSNLLNFSAIPVSTEDKVIVPKGYKATPLMSWGDPIFTNAPEFDQSGKQDSKAQEKQFGDNTDGMSFFPISEDRGVLAINNEYTNYEYLFDHQGKAMTADDVRKAQAAHGVTIVEIIKRGNTWQIDREGQRNRRITAYTPMLVTGPAAGHDLLKTAGDPTGLNVLGTLNNCANGETPWGTYLTCEENFNGYFGSDDEQNKLTDQHKRYGVKTGESDYQWHKHDARFDVAKNPNEPNRFGWAVEIDPHNPNSTPLKRTALGRFKHENAALVINNDGHVVVYLGDDERGEHLYKFVSKHRYQAGNDQQNRNLLEEGTLYVAKFDINENELKGSGRWMELSFGKNGLTPENGFKDQAEVLIFARQAATQVGATTMDRPEWVAVHPDKKHVFCTLTNNKNRGKEGQPVGGPNPREKNNYGQIVRWMPAQGDHTSDVFAWDLYLIAGNPTVHKGTLYAGSENISADNMFNSPDGLGFDAAGRLWIQTDGNYSNQGDFAGQGNNQMLCGDPITGEVKRFLTGPIACEITGLTFSPDHKTMFVGVQHPGEEAAPSHFPYGGTSKPRSTIMMITREDGGVIGA